jgi:hypothetical protein
MVESDGCLNRIGFFPIAPYHFPTSFAQKNYDTTCNVNLISNINFKLYNLKFIRFFLNGQIRIAIFSIVKLHIIRLIYRTTFTLFVWEVIS